MDTNPTDRQETIYKLYLKTILYYIKMFVDFFLLQNKRKLAKFELTDANVKNTLHLFLRLHSKLSSGMQV